MGRRWLGEKIKDLGLGSRSEASSWDLLVLSSHPPKWLFGGDCSPRPQSETLPSLFLLGSCSSRTSANRHQAGWWRCWGLTWLNGARSAATPSGRTKLWKDAVVKWRQALTHRAGAEPRRCSANRQGVAFMQTALCSWRGAAVTVPLLKMLCPRCRSAPEEHFTAEVIPASHGSVDVEAQVPARFVLHPSFCHQKPSTFRKINLPRVPCRSVGFKFFVGVSFSRIL